MARRSRTRSLIATAHRIMRKHSCQLQDINVAKLSAAINQWDRLETRVMWRRQNRPLQRCTGYVPGGKTFRFLAP